MLKLVMTAQFRRDLKLVKKYQQAYEAYINYFSKYKMNNIAPNAIDLFIRRVEESEKRERLIRTHAFFLRFLNGLMIMTKLIS